MAKKTFKVDSCSGTLYATREAAQKKIPWMEKKYSPKRYSPVKCTMCKHWHIKQIKFEEIDVTEEKARAASEGF